jgi:hypothetical protein
MENIPFTNATYELDPDKMDWGDDTPGIEVEDVSGTLMEDAIRACLNTIENAFGWRYLDRDNVKNTKGRLFRVKYFVEEEKRSFFETNWPAYTFVWDAALKHHDHPVSHLATELAELEMLEDWVMEKEQYIDLFGNPSRDKKYKRNAIPVVSLETAKDYLRRLHWNNRCFPFDMNQLCDPSTSLGKIKKIALTHALYYLTMNDLARLLHTSDGRTIKALIHRHSATYGKLNAGEQEYWVSEEGQVTQKNVLTGECYSHRSLEALFRQSSSKTEFGGVTWTITSAGGDSYIVEFVGCPNKVCEDYKPLRFLQQQSWEEYEYSSIRVKKCLGWVWMTATGINGSVRIEDLDLFERLRKYVACKQRTPRLKTETANYARRLCTKEDIISIHGGGASQIPVASMSDYVEVATYVDVRHELDISISMYRENATMVAALNQYYEKGTLPKDMVALTKAAAFIGKTICAPASLIAKDLAVKNQHLLGDVGSVFDRSLVEEYIGCRGYDPEVVGGVVW